MKIQPAKCRIIVAFSMVTLIIALSVILSVVIVKETKEKSVQSVEMTVEDISNQMTGQIKYSQTIMSGIVDMLEGESELDNERVRGILSGFTSENAENTLGLLFPGERLMLANGREIDASDMLSFSELKSKGKCVFASQKSLLGNDKAAVFCMEPIEKNGRTLGILLNSMDGTVFTKLWKADAVFGKADICIADCETGEVISGEWPYQTNNINTLEVLTPKCGSNYSDFQKSVAQHEAGNYAVKNAGNDMFIAYAPLAIEKWMAFINVPESIVMQETDRMLWILVLFGLLEVFAFAVYFAIVLHSSHKENRNREKQLSEVNLTYDIEKLLFEAHRNRTNIRRALRKLAHAVDAQAAFLLFYEDVDGDKSYFWAEDNCEERVQKIIKGLKNITKTANYKNINYTAIKNVDNTVTGLLGVVSPKNRDEADNTLSNVSVSFSMLYSNLHAYMLIKALGERDALTGLLNRNSYENNVKQYPKKCSKSLTCMYVDVNGLHDLNNSKGHEAGDAMLKFVADELAGQFGTADTYRIGGDEFVAFVRDEDIEITKAKLSVITMHLSREGFHASIGTCFKEMPLESMDDLINTAERDMYDAKTNFYRQNNVDRRAARGSGATSIEDFNKMDIVNDFPGGFFICSADREEKIIFANQETQRIFMCDTYEEFIRFVGGSFKGFVHPDDLNMVDEKIKNQVTSNYQGFGQADFRIVRKDGSVVLVESYGHYVNSEKYGKLYYVFIRMKENEQ